MSAILAGSENTTWKYGTGNNSASRSASHSRAAAPWHFGQCRLRQELLACRDRHALGALAAFEPVVLPLEGDAFLVACDQAAISAGNAVGVAREIAQHLLRSSEGVLAVDDPVCLPQRRQIGGECSRMD